MVFSSLASGGRRLPLVRGLTLVVVTCLCLSSQLLPHDGPQARAPQPRVTTLHHEQTVAVVSLTPENIVTRCRLILAEASDQFDKVQLLQHLSRKMSVEKISFSDMMDVIRQGIGINIFIRTKTSSQCLSGTRSKCSKRRIRE